MRFLKVLLVLLIAGSALATNWRAQWIWLPEGEEADMMLARKTFALAEKPETANLSITAGSQYELFVNGTYIARGPARCAPHHQSYDVLDVSGVLRKGENVIAVRVHHQRDGVSYYEPSRAGLLAQLDTSSVRVKTDASWRVSPDKSWMDDSPKMARFHLEVCDSVDLRLASKGWKHTGFDDSGWAKAQVLKRNIGWPAPQKDDRPTYLVPPWTSLVERDIPYLKESLIEGKPVPKRVPVAGAGDCRVEVYDFGEVMNGRSYLDIEAPAGTVVEVMAAPYLLDERLPSPVVASTYTDRIILSGGRQRWFAFYMKPVRWLAVVFRTLEGDANIHEAGVARSEYPFEQTGSFHLPDAPELERYWDASAKTLKVCTTDAYTDNYRERRQYAQTAYYANLGNYPVFGDTALQRRYLMQIAQEQQADGLMPAYAPRHGDDFMVILDSNCFWLRGLHQYLLWSGDEKAVRELLPAARKLLGLLEGWSNADGLIDDPPQPYWLDHAVQDRRGANLCLNGHWLGAVEDMAQVFQWLEEPGADNLLEQAKRMRRAIRGKFWDEGKGFFADALVDGQRSSLFSEHANAMALALKIATPKQMRAVATKLCEAQGRDASPRRPRTAGTALPTKGDAEKFVRRADGTIVVTPAMSYFLFAGLCEAGFADESWELLQQRFGHMLAPETNGTLWEEWWLDGSGRSGKFKKIGHGRSDAQTESAFFPGLFTRYILGVEPTQPGMKEVVLRYWPSKNLNRRTGAIPTPSGLLQVDWNISPSEIKLALKVPEGITAKLAAPAKGNITINNQSSKLKDGFLILPAGSCAVRITQ
ncbi:MAG: alpha-L-rhamnosidase N-terminal domain-containing protein [Kiritimatiellales bacterium]|nr:alpha-L-rhamnosidase N-terminal domain-containing protein [Kiritimatiellales bacterium]